MTTTGTAISPSTSKIRGRRRRRVTPRNQKELFDIDAPYESVTIPDYMTKIFPEQSTPGRYFGRRYR